MSPETRAGCWRRAGAGRDEGALIGCSGPFRHMMALVRRVAPTEIPVLLIGESGTGKELVARAIHGSSARANRNFVPVDCVALAESLFENELFGHEQGAFTGAHRPKPGLLDLAHQGTLFLDEIGNIPLTMQAKLLRVIETGVCRRVGATREHRVDARLISATNRDLDRLVSEGKFRPDLLYRIDVFPIRLPPLRERREDIPMLYRAMEARIGCRCSLDEVAREALIAYDFPGNVRELLNIAQRSCVVACGETIGVRDLPPKIVASRSPPPPVAPAGDQILPLATIEDRYLRWAIEQHRGSRAELARALDISERTLYRKLKQARSCTSISRVPPPCRASG